jgi:hypothetical protein
MIKNKSNGMDEIDISKLTYAELLNLVEIKGDVIVPIEIAAKMKGVSKAAINYAIAKGKIQDVKGVLLSSLKEYEVDNKKRLAGVMGAIAKKENKSNE